MHATRPRATLVIHPVRTTAMPDDPPSDPPGGDGGEPISPAALRKYLGSPDVLAHIGAMVKRRVPRQVVEDVLNDAIVKMCASGALPREAAVGGWVETSTLSAITDHLRKTGRRDGRETAVDDIDERAETAPEPSADRTEWLRKRVKKSRIDAETLAIVEVQAKSDLTRAEVAARHGMTEDALKKRIQRFRVKYEDEWKRERMLIALLWLLGLGIVAAIVAIVLHGRPERGTLPIGPEPIPSASAAPSIVPTDDGRKNIAAPTFDAGPSEVMPKP